MSVLTSGPVAAPLQPEKSGSPFPWRPVLTGATVVVIVGLIVYIGLVDQDQSGFVWIVALMIGLLLALGMGEVTKNSVDPSYRSFLFDVNKLNEYLVRSPNAAIEMSITAAPISERIGYRNPKRGIALFTGQGNTLIRPNTALFVEITLFRDPVDGVFTLS